MNPDYLGLLHVRPCEYGSRLRPKGACSFTPYNVVIGFWWTRTLDWWHSLLRDDFHDRMCGVLASLTQTDHNRARAIRPKASRTIDWARRSSNPRNDTLSLLAARAEFGYVMNATVGTASLTAPGLMLARRSGILFVSASVLLLGLEALETTHILSDPVQGAISFAVSLVVATVVVWTARSALVSSRLSWPIYSLLFAGAVFMLISWTEDLPILDDIPILGRNDKTFRKMTKMLMLACWFTAPPLLAWNLLAVHRRMTNELEQLIADRTRGLSDANAKLQKEIRQHIDTGNELRAAQATIEDLAEKRSQRLAIAEQALVRNERLKALGTFASGVAHELNNTLVPVRSYVELLLRSEGLTHEQKQWLQGVSQGANDAVHVVQSLQQFHGRRRDHDSLSPVDPVEVARQAIDLTRPVWKDEAEADGKRISIETRLDASSNVLANAAELRQVLTNLILNSVDATQGDGKIQVEVATRDGRVEFKVVDSGHGMAAEQLFACFEPFYTTKLKGAGLGLSVSRGIIQDHGGRLDVQSSPGGPTTFEFSLPLEGSRPRQADSPGGEGTGEDFTQLTLLYVEDDAIVRQAFCALLTSMGVETVEADGGKLAIEICRNRRDFNAVIVDMGMPGMNGAETIDALRKLGLSCPSVVISGWPIRTVMERFVDQAPPDFVLTKPVLADELERTLNEIRDRSSRRVGS